MIVDVPTVSPITTPVLPMVATAVLLLLQMPPVVASVKFVVDPAHTVVLPEILLISVAAFTVITKMARHPEPAA